MDRTEKSLSNQSHVVILYFVSPDHIYDICSNFLYYYEVNLYMNHLLPEIYIDPIVLNVCLVDFKQDAFFDGWKGYGATPAKLHAFELNA